ncbi:cellulose biosynthesis cyclic di-GMP-binding regulatory protein BcsB [Fulvimarina sp. MAC3]|uniref:cellulose biosynthesis cyclic di-GMP-binding regulatory protein BcsB n=1 Tax=Fulvimarina sp. MAC3 TaxID=3148887 RepID=UPI0031FC48DE
MNSKHLLGGCLLSVLSAGACLPVADASAQTAQSMPQIPQMPARAVPEGEIESRTLGPLRPLPAIEDDFFLQGESAKIGFDIFVSANEARAGGIFQLAYETDISVMPEASEMAVFFNGIPADRFWIGGGRTAPRRIALPARALKSGWNRVELDVEHRHRVDCSIASTYELWTRIDNHASGFQFAAKDRPSLDHLPLLPLDERGTLVLRVHSTSTQPDAVETIYATAARLARAAGAPAARVEFKAMPWALNLALPQETPRDSPQANQASGIDVYFGNREQVSAMSGEGSRIDAALEDLQISGDGTTALVVDPRDRKRLARLFDRLAAAERTARPAALERPVVDDRTLTFRDLGLESREFSGRLYRTGFRIGLPADAVISDYASAELKLDLGYAAALSGESDFRVLVNGKTAAILPLGRSDGDTMSARSLDIPLTAFRPGENHVEFEAAVARPADRSCAPNLQMRGDPRFLLLETSTITIPRLARMATLPNLAASFSDAGLAGRAGEPTRLAITSFDENSLSAAATFYARIVLSNARLSDPKIASIAEVVAQGGTVFAAAGDVPEEVRAHLEIDEASLSKLAANTSLMSDALSLLGGQTLDTMTTGGIGFISTAEARERDETLENWRASFTVEEKPNYFWDMMVSGTEAIASIGLGGVAEPLAVDDRTSLLMSQAPAAHGNGAVTLVTAASAAALPQEVAHLTEPAQWSRLDGSAALLAGDHIQTVPGFVSSMYATQPLSVGNIRLVIAAWLSMNPAIHAGLLLMAALGFGGATAFAVKGSTGGRRTASDVDKGSAHHA